MKEDKLPARQPTHVITRNELRELLKKFLQEGKEDTFTWENLTTKNGLPHNWIYDLHQDSKDRIWIGTWGGGLALRDGKKWKIFTVDDGLMSNNVTSFTEDKQSRIWIATDEGLNVFDGTKFKEAGLMGKSLLNIICDSKGNVWAGCWRMTTTGGGLFKYDGHKWQSFTKSKGLPGLEILKVFEDSRGNIWVGTYERGMGAGVGCYDGKKWRVYTERDGLIDNCVYSMFEDPDGNMWFGTVGGVSIYNMKKNKWHRVTTLDGLVDDRVYCMMIDSNKKMWFGTEGGVSRLDGKSWQSFTKKDGLVENLVRAILEDRKGNLWFGTYPYTEGRGGISIAKYSQKGKSLPEKILKYLPKKLRQKSLEKKNENSSNE